MAEKNLLVGDKAFLPVIIEDSNDIREHAYPIRCAYRDKARGALTAEQTFCIQVGSTDYLMTAEEVASRSGTDWQSKYDECSEEANRRITELEAECEKYRQSNIALRRTVDALTTSEDRNTHRAMLMDSLIEILLEKINEMRR